MQTISPWFRTARLVTGIRKVYGSSADGARSNNRRVYKIVREPGTARNAASN